MEQALVYYNPKCGTCRKVRETLEKRGIPARYVEYLKTPPSVLELDQVLKILGVEPLQIVRAQEPIFEKKFAGKTLTRAQWLEALHAHPELIQRPIVVWGKRAIVARPAEIIESFLNKEG
jgi:arsenate reductase